ncbi:DUF5947 family protein [Jatrophihabitans sp. DSM 45814]
MTRDDQVPAGGLSVLARFAAERTSQPDIERCEMCGESIGAVHSHVVNLTSRSLLCTCRPCTLLFAYDHAELRYRAVPDRFLSFPGLLLSPAVWDDLQIPVGLVFLFHNSNLGHTVAFYPGPAGATESELPMGAWDEVVSDHPELGIVLPDVEALILHDKGDRGAECYLVPIDNCYELVGRLRQVWRGFDGGQEARALVVDYFADLESRSRVAPASTDRGAVP